MCMLCTSGSDYSVYCIVKIMPSDPPHKCTTKTKLGRTKLCVGLIKGFSTDLELDTSIAYNTMYMNDLRHCCSILGNNTE